jgi:ribosomal protein S12 methylthiotransferase accessory factor
VSAVLVVGGGLLADFVCDELSLTYQVVRQAEVTTAVPEAIDLALVLDDAWHPSVHQKAEEVYQPACVPWLRGFISFGQGVVGPLVRSGTPGCSQCADMRRLMASTDRKDMWDLQQTLAVDGGMSRDAWASRTGLLQVAHLLVAEAYNVLEGSGARTEQRVFLANLKTLKTSRHFVLPNPLCPVCGQLPEDSRTAADISLGPSPKVSVDSFRCRPMDDFKEALAEDYLDYQTGLLNGRMHDLTTTFAAVSVNLPLFQADEASAGRTHSYAESELTAIFEALERYCGLSPRGKRTVIHDSFAQLRDQALNPVTVGVHAKEQYARPDYPFKPFDATRPIRWVWGYSFMQARPILVPELLAYYSLGCGDGFVYETSNGCAVGGSLEEAILHGILEVVERDGFLLTWYAQLSVPGLDLGSVEDKELRLMVNRLQAVTGYDLHLFNTTMENEIPSVWAVAKNTRQQGVNLICAAGAHLNPLRAVKSAVHELAGMLQVLDEKLEANREVYVRMYHNPFQVQQMEDHSMLYSLPQAESRLHFLMNHNRPLQTFAEAFKPRALHTDLTDDLKGILQVFRGLQLDVIVVDQTTPEIRRNGLHCVKVLIPGMLPMTFGHHLTRLEGLDRVLRIPVTLGYAKQPLRREQLNPHPHPFP